MKPDPEFVVALALGGHLPEEQTLEVLAATQFRASTMGDLRLTEVLNKVSQHAKDVLSRRVRVVGPLEFDEGEG